MGLDAFPEERYVFDATTDSASINNMKENIFEDATYNPYLTLENGEITNTRLANDNCEYIVTFYPAEGSTLAHVTIVVTATLLPTGYAWADEYNDSLTFTAYIEAPLTITEIKLPYVGGSYDGSYSLYDKVTLNETYEISLSDTYLAWDDSAKVIIPESFNGNLEDFFVILKRWHENALSDPNGVSIGYTVAQTLPGIASNGQSVSDKYIINSSGIPVTWSIQSSDVNTEDLTGTYVATCELNKNATLLGYDLVNSDPAKLTITLVITEGDSEPLVQMNSLMLINDLLLEDDEIATDSNADFEDIATDSNADLEEIDSDDSDDIDDDDFESSDPDVPDVPDDDLDGSDPDVPDVPDDDDLEGSDPDVPDIPDDDLEDTEPDVPDVPDDDLEDTEPDVPDVPDDDDFEDTEPDEPDDDQDIAINNDPAIKDDDEANNDESNDDVPTLDDGTIE